MDLYSPKDIFTPKDAKYNSSRQQKYKDYIDSSRRTATPGN